MDFTIKKVVVKVPKRFVEFNGERWDWEEFQETTEILKKLGQDSVSAETLSWEWLKEWKELGVIEQYEVTQADGWGGELSWQRVKQGKEYDKFMTALKGFEVRVREEAAAAAKEAKRKRLLAELRSLDQTPLVRHLSRSEPTDLVKHLASGDKTPLVEYLEKGGGI